MSTQVETMEKSASGPKPSSAPSNANLLQRKCACGGTSGPDGECAECRKKRLQRSASGRTEPRHAPPIVHEVLRSSGKPLDPEARAFMEPRFQYDFGQVRVHTDAKAARSARAVNAMAYTVGQELVFEAGQYTPGTMSGQRLLAHELAHVVQQARGGTSAPSPLPYSMLEQAADRAASTLTRGSVPIEVAGASAPGLARQPRSLVQSLDPGALSDEELEQEIDLIRQWLRDNPISSLENDQLMVTLQALESEARRRQRPNEPPESRPRGRPSQVSEPMAPGSPAVSGVVPRPRSLSESLAPNLLSEENLEQEISSLRQWLLDNPNTGQERDDLLAQLDALESEVRRRAVLVQVTPWTDDPDSANGVSLWQVECVKRRGGCPSTRSGGVPTPDEISRLNEMCRRETQYAGPDVTPNDAQCAAPMTEALSDFKRLVRAAGKVHLANNRQVLEQWKDFLQRQLTPEQLRTQIIAQEASQLLRTAERGGLQEIATAEQWFRTRGPNERWVLQQQIEGRFHACQGCHAMVKGQEWDRLLEESGAAFQTPLEQISIAAQHESAAPSPRPRVGPEQAEAGASPEGGTSLTPVFPATTAASQSLEAIGPYLQELGPEGYQVLPEEVLGSTAPPRELMADVIRRINQRQADFEALSRMIDNPDYPYLNLRPIVRQLLPTAEPYVRVQVESEIAAAEDWEIVKTILVGAATLGALVLTIFPPTSAAGVAGLVALGGALTGYGIGSGIASYQEGRRLALGRGAHDVFDPEQQQAADLLMATGILSIVLEAAPLVAAGVSRAVSRVRLLRAGTGGVAGELGALHTIEGKVGAGANEATVHITDLDTPNPQVRVTAADGTTIYEDPAASLTQPVVIPPSRQLAAGEPVVIPPSRQLAAGEPVVIPPSGPVQPPAGTLEPSMPGQGGGAQGATRIVLPDNNTLIVDSQVARALGYQSGTVPPNQAALSQAQAETLLLIGRQPPMQRGVALAPRTLEELQLGPGTQTTIYQILPPSQYQPRVQQAVLAGLERLNVGRTAADRQIVMEALLSSRATGTTPVFVTADRDLINGLARSIGIDPSNAFARASKGGPQNMAEYVRSVSHADTFTISVPGFEGRQLHVRPVQPVRSEFKLAEE